MVKEPAFIQPAPYLRWLFPGSFWRMNKKEKLVYLTFDDGPHPEITPWVINMLNEYNQNATFFCIGKNLNRFPNVVYDIEKSGNTIGNHSYSHDKSILKDNEQYLLDIENSNRIYPTNLFRPPYGKINFHQFFALKKKYRIIFWDVLTYDYDERFTGEQCALFVKKYCRNGSIITFHDSEKAFSRLKIALPIVLDYLKNMGYKSLPIKIG